MDTGHNDLLGELAADAAGEPRLVQQQRAARLRDAREHAVPVEGSEAAKVEDLRLDASGRELCRGIERRVHHRAERDDRQVLSFAPDGGFPDGHDVVLVGHLVFDPAIEVLVLEVQHRIVVPNRRLQQALRIVRGRRLHHLQSGRIEKEGFRVQRMERPAAHAAAAGTPNDDGNPGAVAIAARRCEIREHVEAAGDEINELDFAHGTHAHVRRADRRTYDGGLGNRRVDDAPLAVGIDQSFRDLEGPAVDADVFPDHEYALVARHFVEERLANSF